MSNSVEVSISEVKDTLKQYFATSNAHNHYIDWAVDLAIDHDLEGNTFSGIGAAEKYHKALLSSVENESSVVFESPSLKHIKGNGVSSKILTKDILDRVDADIAENGMVSYGLFDCGYSGGFTTFVRALAAKDYVAIFSAAGGPQGVVPYGGRKDIFGTNPLAYAIPNQDDPIVFDAATAKIAYGTLREAKEKKEKLLDNTYVDIDGDITTDYDKGHAVLPFGGFKGYAINMLLEVITTIMVGGNAGLLQNPDGSTSQKDLGAFIIVIDPARMVDINEFKKQTSQLVADVESSEPMQGFTEVRAPGTRASAHKKNDISRGKVSVGIDDWKHLQALAQASRK